MKLNNDLLKKILKLVLFIAIVIWLGLLTQKSNQHNQSLTSINQKLANNEMNINYQRVNEKLAQLSEQMDSVQNKNNEVVMQMQLSEVEDELKNRIQQVSRQFEETASHDQLQKLQHDVTSQLTVQTTQLAILSSEIALLKNNPSKTRSIPQSTTKGKSASTTVAAPFVIQDKELRAGELVLSVLPIKQKSIESSVLVAVGETFGTWQLLAIDEQSALFKVGSQKRRLTIPQ